MSAATETIAFLANYNSWRRGDETLEMPSPAEIGATIDDAVNLLRKHDKLELERDQLRAELATCKDASESSIESLRAEVERLKKQIKDDNRSYGCELRDPYGTIWEQATKDHDRAGKAERALAELREWQAGVIANERLHHAERKEAIARAERAEAELATAPITEAHKQLAREIMFGSSPEAASTLAQHVAQLIADNEAKVTKVLWEVMAERDQLRAERDALLEIAWLDTPDEPHETVAQWRVEFGKGWERKAVCDQLRAELAESKNVALATAYAFANATARIRALVGAIETDPLPAEHYVAEALGKLRAEVERLKDHAFDKDGTPWKTVCGWWSAKYDSAERQMSENAARAARAEAALATERARLDYVMRVCHATNREAIDAAVKEGSA